VTIKRQLHSLVDLLDDENADEALDYLQWLVSDAETVSGQDLERTRRGEEQIARGEYVTLQELRQELSE
jgi:hypothetical protein